MSDLTLIEKRALEKAFGMASGYVLNFSNRTFSEFFLDSVNIDIFSNKYNYSSGSKANRMRAFWNEESNYIVGKLLDDIFEIWEEVNYDENLSNPPENCLRIVRRLKESVDVPDIESIRAISDDKNFETLARSVKEAIEKNEPEAGLDRLHTYLIKYFRALCKKYGITTEREKPLHSLVGEYVRALKKKGKIESEMAERILKSSISVMDAFNKVRNEQSLAHDNEVLTYNESILIFSHIASSIRFIEMLESGKSDSGETEPFEIDDIPF